MMTKAQHALLKLAEEATEVAGRAMKAMQFGMDEVEPGQPLTNLKRLELEVMDLHAAMFRLHELDVLKSDLDNEALKAHILAKDSKVDRYYALSKALGQVE